MLARDLAARAALDDPGDVASLLDALHDAGADDQVAVLLARDPAARAALDNPGAVVSSAGPRSAEASADEQAKVLVERLPVEGLFDLFLRQAGHEVPVRFGREADGNPASSWGWDDLD